MLADRGFHAAQGTPANLKRWRRGEWKERMGIETACSLRTTVCGLKKGWQRTAAACQRRLAYLAARCNTLVTLNQPPPPEVPSLTPALHLAHYAI